MARWRRGEALRCISEYDNTAALYSSILWCITRLRGAVSSALSQQGGQFFAELVGMVLHVSKLFLDDERTSEYLGRPELPKSLGHQESLYRVSCDGFEKSLAPSIHHDELSPAALEAGARCTYPCCVGWSCRSPKAVVQESC